MRGWRGFWGKTISFKEIFTKPVFFFASIIFFLYLGDAVMSYISPVIIEKNLNNNFLMGLVISTSSIAGFCADYLFGKIFGNKNYIFFLLLGSLLAILFPGVFLFFPPAFVYFVLAMAIWGIYFELWEFGTFSYIKSFHHTFEHPKVWGIISAFKGASYMIGPVIASFALRNGETSSLSLVILLLVLSLVFSLVFKSRFGVGSTREYEETVESLPSQSYIRATFEIFRHIWPVWVFTLVLYIVDSTFWTTGALFSEELGARHVLGNLFLSVYMLPSILVGFITGAVARPFGKKRIAYVSGLMQGVAICAVGVISDVPGILVTVFISAVFGAIAVPEMLATAEDYVARLKGMGSIMISLDLTAVSLGYVIGPVLSGYISEISDVRKAFVVVGMVLSVASILMFLFTPRKIHLPQKEIHSIAMGV